MTDTSWQGELTEEARAERAVDGVDAAGRPRLQGAGRALLRELLRPYRAQVWAVLGIALAQVLFTMAAPWLVGVAIDDSLPDARHGDYTSLTVVGVALVLSALGGGWLRAVFVVRSGRIGQAVMYDLRRRGYDHMQALSVAFHERFTSGRVISRLTSDVDTLNELLEAGLDGLLTAVFNIVAIAVILLILDVPLALVAIGALVPLYLLYRWFSARAAVAFRRTRENVATLIVNIVETFNGIRAVQAFRREKRNDAIFADLNDTYREANRRTFTLQAWFIPGTALVGNLATVAVLLIGGRRVIEGGLELGVLTSFLLYLRQFYDPMEDLGIFYNSLQSATAALEKIAAVLAVRPDVPEPEHLVDLPVPVGGALDLDGVSFAYSAEHVVLPKLSLHVPAGQTVALVGATGAGKTTIAKLLPASTTRRRAASGSTASTCATSRTPSCAARS